VQLPDAPPPAFEGPLPTQALAGAAAGMVVLVLGLLVAPAWPWRLACLLVGAAALFWGFRRLRSARSLHRLATQQAQAGRQDSLLGMVASASYELDDEGRVLRVVAHEPALTAALGPADQGRLLWQLAGIEFPPGALRSLQDALHAARRWQALPAQRRGADGTLRQLQFSGQARQGEDGSVLGFVGLVRDVTAEVQAQQTLQRSQSRFHELFRRIPTALVVHRAGIVLDANPSAVALFGFSDLGSMLGCNLLEAYEAGPSRARAWQRLQELASLPAGRTLPPVEFRLAPNRGRLVIVQASSVTVEAEDGSPASLTIYIDDTERRQAEQALQRSEALLSHLVANSPDLITLTELDTGRYAMVNPTFVRVTGWASHEVIGKTSEEVHIWADPADRQRLVAALHAAPMVQSMPVSFQVRDGRRVAMLLSAARFSMDGRDYLIINARDITAAEQARLEREAILENALVGIALTRDQHFMMVNPRFEQMLGWPPGLLVGRHASEVWPTLADHEEVGQLIGPRLAHGEQIEIERPLRRRDGSQFLGRLLAKAVDPTHPSRGGTIWLAEDVTGRRQDEKALAKARDEAEAASRAKSAFLANTSHEIRTPLNALLGLARLARMPALDESRRRQYIEQISDSAETLSGILSDILDLSKIEAGKMHLDAVVFDLHALLNALHQAYGALADTKGLTLDIERDADLPEAVVGDPVRVRQILSNYLNNALKFTETGCLRLAARVLRPGLVRFEVIDTGPGIDETTQARLFHPFTQADVSVTRAFGGTGLGLSICRELAEMMGGQVGVVSVPGQGSCFWAELPLAPADPQALDSGSTGSGTDPIVGARVLMVEDNPVNMMIAVAMLEQWGAVVSQAGDGLEAVQAVDDAVARGNPFDVVLMDVQMPAMSGHDATLQLRRRYDRFTLPIVALTAAALVSERNQALAAGMNDFLTKPIDAMRLRHTLVRVLRSRLPSED
jgi:PAS domain S-box-containing protein